MKDPKSFGNRLFYGDNLEVLRRHIPDDSIDLAYLDPPFNSNASYNVLFKQHDGARAASQLHAFHDTWEWNEESQRTYEQVVESGGDVSRALQAFRVFLGTSNMLAYLTMMAPRLIELRRALKGHGSLVLHADPSASHYLKILLDAIFGPEQFVNEIVWKRTSAHNDSKRFGRIHDVLFLYHKGKNATFNVQRTPLDPKYVEKVYSRVDENGRRYRLDNISAPGGRGPVYEWGGKTQPWRYTKEKMHALYKQGRIKLYPDGTAMINAYVRYLDENEGVPVQDWWGDIGVIAAPSGERLGYPTQKPEALLDRIILACSNEGDVVLDAFCGCGTTIASAQRLGRRWIGIDIAEPAIQVIKKRFVDRFGIDLGIAIGEPESVEDAAALAASDPYQFQWWALGLVDARPNDQKKGADKGIDGRRYFVDPSTGKTEQIIFSVKAGHVTVDQVRVLQAVVAREKATIGVLISMEPATRPMKVEAVSAGIAVTSWGRFPVLQLVTVGELLAGKRIDAPPARQLDITYPKAPKADPKPTMPTDQPDLGGLQLNRRMRKAGLPDPGKRRTSKKRSA